MKICTEHDGDVCYEERTCPACILQKTIDDLNDEVNALKDEVKSLEGRQP